SATSSSGTSGTCLPASTQACYSGAPGTEGNAPCRGGTATCEPDGSGFGGCVGGVTPQPASRAGTSDGGWLGDADCGARAGVIGTAGGATVGGATVDAKGYVYVVGWFGGVIQLPGLTLTAKAGSSGADAFLIKLDVHGTPVWGRNFGGPSVTARGSVVAVDDA